MTRSKTKAPPAAADDMKEIRMLYVGMGETIDGKTAYLWLPEDQFTPDMDIPTLHGKASLFEGKKGKTPRVIGGVYIGKAVQREDGRITRMEIGPRWEAHPPKSYKQVWVQVDMINTAIATRQRMKKLEGDAAKMAHMTAQLMPIHKVWLLTDSRGRAAIEATVLRLVRGL